MKQARLTEEEVIRILRENEVGAKAGELARKHGVSEGMIYAWKAKFGGSDRVPRRGVATALLSRAGCPFRLPRTAG